MAKLAKKAAAQLREHLAGQPADRLVELLMAWVERNSALKDELLWRSPRPAARST